MPASPALTSRERVHRALRREPVDRVPVYLWFHPETTRRLAARLDLPPALVGLAFGHDVVQAWVGNNAAMEGVVHERDGGTHRDAWGIRWVRAHGFNQIQHSPLAETEAGALDAYEFPRHPRHELLAPMAQIPAAAADGFRGCDVSPCVFEMYARLRGLERALLDLAEHPAAAERFLGRCATAAADLADAACARFRLDWLWTGDDVASQRGMLMSPGQWRTLIKPHLARVTAVARRHGLWCAYHCCGAMRPIIPDLIEIGVQVLNPVQPSCPGMDPLELKREYGQTLAFMGGLDTERLLPRGSEREVRAGVRRLLDGMAGGGFILAAAHTVPPETPDANLFALYAEAGIPRQAILDRAADLRRRARGA